MGGASELGGDWGGVCWKLRGEKASRRWVLGLTICPEEVRCGQEITPGGHALTPGGQALTQAVCSGEKG